jgi:hypothetical protein
MRVFLLNLFLSFTLIISNLFAQQYPDLFNYYANHQIDLLREKLQQSEYLDDNHPEILFFRTVFSDNGDNALSVYERLFNQSMGPLKNLTAQKLSEYYFARGFYVKSSEYKNIAKAYIPVKTSEKIITGDNKIEKKTEEQRASIYKIQVGAFGVRENADDLTVYLKGKNLDVNVVRREINGSILFCVWVEGESDIAGTEELAKEIKEKYDLSYRIVKP